MKSLLLFLTCLAATTACLGQASFFDPSFGSGGKTIINYSGIVDGIFEAVAIQTDGKIVVAGTLNSQATVGRFKENGTPDSAFAVNGFYTYPSIGSVFYDFVIQPDSKIVVEGNISLGLGNRQFFTVRLNIDGSPDGSFGSSGIDTTDFGPFSNDYGKAIALQADGKIVIAGEVGSMVGVARLLPAGGLDNSFDTDGVAKYTYGGLKSVAVAPDGKIVAGGTYSPGDHLLAMRILPTGELDTTFNHTGIAHTLAGGSWNYGGVVRVLPDGKILVAGSGTFGAQGSDFVVLRYNTNGTLDASFGIDGIAHIDFINKDDQARAMVITPDGKILLAGNATMTDKEDYGIARLNADGSLDLSFGNEGKIVNPIRTLNDRPRALALQTDGKIVLSGSSVRSNPSYDPAIARFLPIPSSVAIIDQPVNRQFYPNPTTGEMDIDRTIDSHILSISACNVLGRRIELNKTAGHISLLNAPDGLYFLNIVFDDRPPVIQKVLLIAANK